MSDLSRFRHARALRSHLSFNPNLMTPFHWGEVHAINAGPPPTLDVRLEGTSVVTPAIPYLGSYTPTLGDAVVLCKMQGQAKTAFWVLGALRGIPSGPAGGGHYPTVSVAAANSTDKDKAIADFICTGVHDEVQIQNAVDQVNTFGGGITGGRVQLLEGTFFPYDTVTVFPNPNLPAITIVGLGAATVIDCTNLAFEPLFVIESNDGNFWNSIEDLTILNLGATTAVRIFGGNGQTVIDKLVVQSQAASSDNPIFDVSGASPNVIRNCSVYNLFDQPVVGSSFGGQLKMHDCTIEGQGNDTGLSYPVIDLNNLNTNCELRDLRFQAISTDKPVVRCANGPFGGVFSGLWANQSAGPLLHFVNAQNCRISDVSFGYSSLVFDSGELNSIDGVSVATGGDFNGDPIVQFTGSEYESSLRNLNAAFLNSICVQVDSGCSLILVADCDLRDNETSGGAVVDSSTTTLLQDVLV